MYAGHTLKSLHIGTDLSQHMVRQKNLWRVSETEQDMAPCMEQCQFLLNVH